MQDDNERFRFIDLAVGPLGKTAEAELARGELMSRVMHAEPAAGDDTLAMAEGRLEKSGSARLRWAALTITGLVVLIGALVPIVKAAWEEGQMLNPLYHFSSSWYHWTPKAQEHITASLNREEKIFLLANTGNVDDLEVLDWRKEVVKEPTTEYLEEIVAEGLEGQLPLFQSPRALASNRERRFPSLDCLLEWAAEQEPDNGRWPLETARILHAPAVSFDPSGRRAYLGDPGHLREAVKLIEKAAALPRIESQLQADTRRRLQLIGPVATVADQVPQNQFLSVQRERLPYGHQLHSVWLARGQELVREKDPAAWKAWVNHWAKIELALPAWGKAQTEGAELERLAATASAFAVQATDLGLAEEAARLKKVFRQALTLPRYLSVDEYRAAATITGGNHSRQLAVVEDLSAYTSGRMAEYALADRFIALGAALFFALLGWLAFLEGWRRLPAQRGLAASLMPLFGRRDFAWLAGLGILLPLAWHVITVRFTPLGWRDAGLSSWTGPLFFLQAAASLLFAWCMLLQTARWRIARRAGFAGLRSDRMWIGWVAAAVVGIFVPVAGIVRYVPWKEQFLMFCGAALGLPLLWVIWRAAMAIFQPREAALGGVIACRLLIPFFTAAAALCLLLMIPLRAEEKKWVAQDRLGGPDPAGALLQQAEARGLERLREQLREVWNEK